MHVSNPPDNGPVIIRSRQTLNFIERTARFIAIAGPLFAGLALAVSATAQTCPEWNLAADFRVSPNQENPNRDRCGNDDVWYFMESAASAYPAHTPATYSLLSEFTNAAFSIPGLEQWHGTFISNGPTDMLPAVGINNTGMPQAPRFIAWNAGAVRVHPLPDQFVIVGWRSPMNGAVSVSGDLTDIDRNCGNGVSWFIDRFDGSTNTTLAFGVIPNDRSQTFQAGVGGATLAAVPVREGDFLYFIIDAVAGEHRCDSTMMNLRIRPIATEIPMMSFPVMIILAVGLCVTGAIILGRAQV